MLRSIYAATLLSASVLVCASPPSASAEPRPDPLDAKVPVPAPKHQSSLAGYRRHVEVKLAPWKESNDTAGRIGGWRAYARETQESAAPSSGASAPSAGQPTSAPARTPAADHQGHQTR